MTREPQEPRPTPDPAWALPKAKSAVNQNSKPAPALLKTARASSPATRPHDPVVYHIPAFKREAGLCPEPDPPSSSSTAAAPASSPRRSVYKAQRIHKNNTYKGDASLYPGSKACPPAGSTAYALDRRITATHPLYVNPPFLPLQFPPAFVNFRELVGDPGIRNGTQNNPLNEWRNVPEGHWSAPSTFGDGVATWETATNQACTDNLPRHKQRPPAQAPQVKSEHKATAASPDSKEDEESTDEAEEVAYKQPKRRRGKRASAPSKKLEEEQAVKRVKNKRIERPFLIGSEAWPLDETNSRKPDTPEEHTKGWRVYVKVPPGQPEITTWLRKVQFKIFHTYTNPTRMVDEPPFQIEETGWGGFTVEVKLFFVPEVGARPQDRSHFLQLEPYGTEAEQEKQKKDKMVRSELLDYVEFNEPTEAMFDILTSEDQFKAGKAGKGKGKAKLKREEGEETTVALPETSSTSNQYSKELEQQLLEILKKAESQVDEQLDKEASRAKALEAQLKELQPENAATAAATASK